MASTSLVPRPSPAFCHFSVLQATESWVGPGNEARPVLVVPLCSTTDLILVPRRVAWVRGCTGLTCSCIRVLLLCTYITNFILPTQRRQTVCPGFLSRGVAFTAPQQSVAPAGPLSALKSEFTPRSQRRVTFASSPIMSPFLAHFDHGSFEKQLEVCLSASSTGVSAPPLHLPHSPPPHRTFLQLFRSIVLPGSLAARRSSPGTVRFWKTLRSPPPLPFMLCQLCWWTHR